MRVAIIVVCVIGIAGLWLWALMPSGPQASLPEEYCGEFRMHDFIQPQDSAVSDPFQVGGQVLFSFRSEGTYLYRAVVDSGYEIDRAEGVAWLDEDGRLVLRQMSKNRALLEAPDQSYRPAWIEDPKAGRLLSLTAIPEGYRVDLKPVE